MSASEHIPLECPACKQPLDLENDEPLRLEIAMLVSNYSIDGVAHEEAPHPITAYHTHIAGQPIEVVILYPCCEYRLSVEPRVLSIEWEGKAKR